MTTLANVDLVPVKSVRPHPENPRKGNVHAIGVSIDTTGFYGAIIVQRSTGFILAGNHRWKALKAKGATEVPVVWADVDDDRARRIMLADNRIADLGGYDREAQAALVALMPAEVLDALGVKPVEPPDENEILDTLSGPRSCTLTLTFASTDEYDEVVRLAATLRDKRGVASNADLLWDLANG